MIMRAADLRFFELVGRETPTDSVRIFSPPTWQNGR
jgi:hypothetical protein